jgi:uncharacterized protein YdiU (UPF0061 family)
MTTPPAAGATRPTAPLPAALDRVAPPTGWVGRFDNRFTAELPGDPDPSLERRQVLGACWSGVMPTPVPAPRLLAHSPEMATALGLTADDVRAPWFAQVMAGNALVEGMVPTAACYGGHQFGAWAGQLGDGRAISLGELRASDGGRWELQLKGAGPTPYSRTADGRAVLRSSIREFLCSEAMHHLGVPTTRALSLVTTGARVVRDMFYNGNARPEPGAIVCRVAPSFIRFGNFELLAARRDVGLLAQLVDFTIARDFPHLEGETLARRAQWFVEVCERTAQMVVEWMRVGFVHAVMNTDNMSILGLTIDYGPYGWLDDFDPHFTPNTTDSMERRYRFAQQPAVAQWNVARLADAVRPVMESDEVVQRGMDRYVDVFTARYGKMLAAKFGVRGWDEEVRELADAGLTLLHEAEVDYTGFFRALGEVGEALPGDDEAVLALLGDVFYDAAKRTTHGAALAAWMRRWHARVTREGGSASVRRARMHAVNPRYVLRNYLAQQAIDAAASGDPTLVHTLLDVMRRPYEEQPGNERFAERRPEWARYKPGCSRLSCSS